MKKKIVDTPRRPTKLDAVINAESAEFAHMSTAVITGRMRVLRVEADECDRSIVGTMSALAQLRDHRAKLEARMTGLHVVVDKRK